MRRSKFYAEETAQKIVISKVINELVHKQIALTKAYLRHSKSVYNTH